METGAGQLPEATLTLLQGNHPVAGLVGFISHQNYRNIQSAVLKNIKVKAIKLSIQNINLNTHFTGRAQLASSFVVINKELEATALVKGTLIRNGVHQYKSIRPPDVGLQSDTV